MLRSAAARRVVPEPGIRRHTRDQRKLNITGSLLNPEVRSKSAGHAMARIDLTDDIAGYRLRPVCIENPGPAALSGWNRL